MQDRCKIFHASWGLFDPSDDMYKIARSVCDIAGKELGESSTTKHRDGDTLSWCEEHVRGKDIYVFQSYVKPHGERLYELNLFLDGIKSGEPRKARVVMPFAFGARGDRRTRNKEGINSVILAKSLRSMSAAGIITIGIHNLMIGSIYDALDMSFDNVEFEPVAANYIIGRYQNDKDITLITDSGGVKRIRNLARYIRDNSDLQPELAMVDKVREKPNVADIDKIIGDIENRHLIFYDDMGDTYGTMEGSLEAAKLKNPKSMSAIIIHGVNSPGSNGKRGAEEVVSDCFSKGLLEELVITDTVPLKDSFKQIKGVKVISVAPLIYEAIRVLENDESRRLLYDYDHIVSVYKKLSARSAKPCDNIELIR